MFRSKLVRRCYIICDHSPKVSIGIPVFDGASYLSETIDCILAQSYANFELVISDNASSDETEDICRSYIARDPRVRYERQQQNRGAPWNYNRVFELSKGKYFKWAAHDDLFDRTFLARCVEVLDSNPEIVWSQTRVGVIDRHGQTVRTKGCDLSGAAEVLTIDDRGLLHLVDSEATRFAHQRFRSVLLGNTACFDIYGLIRSDVLKCTSLWRPRFGWEKVLVGALSLRGRCAEIPLELFYFRIHDEACSAKDTLAEETAWSNPSETKSTLNALVRLQLLSGHIRNVLQAPIGLWGRINCLFGIGTYLLQFHKWPLVLRQVLRNKGIGGSTRETLKEQEEPKTPDFVELVDQS